MDAIQQKLVATGVKNLQEFGYPSCNVRTILTDSLYWGFFKGMLKDNLGNGAVIDAAINGLLAEYDKPVAPVVKAKPAKASKPAKKK